VDVRVAEFHESAEGIHISRTPDRATDNGHWYETQWWNPTPSDPASSTQRLSRRRRLRRGDHAQLFYCQLIHHYSECKARHAAHRQSFLDEQAIFTPNAKD